MAPQRLYTAARHDRLGNCSMGKPRAVATTDGLAMRECTQSSPAFASQTRRR